MKMIKWLGHQRIIPGVCVLTAGDERYLPDWMADSFVAQKLAEHVVNDPPPFKSRKKEVK